VDIVIYRKSAANQAERKTNKPFPGIAGTAVRVGWPCHASRVSLCIHSAYQCPAQNRATNATQRHCKRVGRTTRFWFIDDEASGETDRYAVEDGHLKKSRPAGRSNACLGLA
jgi:hypothetical protein